VWGRALETEPFRIGSAPGQPRVPCQVHRRRTETVRTGAGSVAPPGFPGVLVLILLLTLPSVVGGFQARDESPVVHPGRPRFVADAATYLGRDGPEVVIMFEVPYSELFFRPFGAHFRSAFDVILVLQRDGMQAGGDLWHEEARVAEHSDTEDRSIFVRRSCTIPATPGDHKVEVIMRESAAGRDSRLEWQLAVPDYEQMHLSISSLWVTDETTDDDCMELPPPRPVLFRSFGEPLAPREVVGEVYRASPGDDPVRIAWRVTDSRGETSQQGEQTLPARKSVPFRIRPDLAQLWLGAYEFDMRARAGGREARRGFGFQIEATSGAFDVDVERSLELIAIIADRQEMEHLEDLPAGERKEAWNRFWQRRDPDPGTPENEFRDEFFARVRYANEHFSVLEPGWKSDRGRVYIRYGPPDQIESSLHRMYGPPHEIWIYLELGRRFVFVDYEGFGRYQLHGPG